MIRRKITVYLLLFLSIHISVFASDEDVHNRQLLQVLFGRSYTTNAIEQKQIEVLEMALFLAIDEFNGYNLENYLSRLKAVGIKNLPKAEQIDFTSNYSHQRATHQGWDFNYPSPPVQERWVLRKQLLVSAIDKIFNFKRNEMIKRDSFAALLYYTHILGDHIGDGKKTYLDRLAISTRPDYRFNRSGENMLNPTVFTELIYHIERLFREQTTSPDYRLLMLYLERNKSREFPASITDDEYIQLQSFALETLNKLIEYIPPLLRKENFFTRVFKWE
jgi:hypothetical protein